MTFVGVMGFAESLRPFGTIEIGEKGVCIVSCCVDFSDTETVGKRQSLTINGCAADNKDFLGIVAALLSLMSAVVKRILQRGKHVSTKEGDVFIT